MKYDHILVEEGKISCVTLNRPEVKNAMDDTTLREISDAFARLSRSPSLRAVVVSGAGGDFCAGADIGWMRRAGRLKPAAGRKDARLLARMCRAVDECPVPVIAKVQGSIYGGGLGLVSVCDIVVAEENARMSFSECRLGLLPAVVSCFVLPKISSRARRYYLTAEVFGMAEAAAMGLVHERVGASDLDGKVRSLVEKILRNGPCAVREAKALIRRWPLLKPDRRVPFAVDTLVRVRSSPEAQEGLGAFLEKRPPSWLS